MRRILILALERGLRTTTTTTSPATGARFSFWHPDLVTLHLWVWYPNPAGLSNATNPYIRPFNHT